MWNRNSAAASKCFVTFKVSPKLFLVGAVIGRERQYLVNSSGVVGEDNDTVLGATFFRTWCPFIAYERRETAGLIVSVSSGSYTFPDFGAELFAAKRCFPRTVRRQQAFFI